MIDKRKESLFLLFQKRAEWFKNLLVRAVTLARKVHPSQTEAQPMYPTVGGVVEVGIGMCMSMRLSIRSSLCGFILKGLIRDLLFLLLKDDLSLLGVSGVPLCSPLSVLWVCVVCSLHPHMMDLRGNTCKFNCSRGS